METDAPIYKPLFENDLKTKFSYAIDRHMKRFIFRKDWQGFNDWILSINKMRMYINAHKNGHSWIKHEEYTEANWWYTNYLEFMRGLTENQKEYIRTREKHHFPQYDLVNGQDIDFIFKRWMKVVTNFKLNKLEEITNKEVGDAVKAAREYRGLNRTQVACVLGIGQDTLKRYEEGRRTLPFDIYYKLIQIFEFDIGILKMK